MTRNVVPCSYFFADGGFYVGVRGRSAWGEYLERDGHVCLCIDDNEMNRVQVKGQAELLDGPPLGLPERIDALWKERLVDWQENTSSEKIKHYWAYYRSVKDKEPMRGFFIKPTQITSWKGGIWAKRYKHADW